MQPMDEFVLEAFGGNMVTAGNLHGSPPLAYEPARSVRRNGRVIMRDDF
ncbi:hypothetical protein [Methylovulum psychrotolerans]|nr:hypothetical protein [Methylovulum psychrotolerans]